ncbi:putative transposase protein [Ralstonia pseudosolanacearum GMI1000]|uniref:Transposase protein n=1 Tax=Ralstonia nicotianae (strain ATCC BAA-1114 / GMI1000) TaxID=267608 RepID=Q8XQC6_RALN1|nr:putative transposase protein [Ralstonia pseudosolanacearum GMI1000]
MSEEFLSEFRNKKIIPNTRYPRKNRIRGSPSAYPIAGPRCHQERADRRVPQGAALAVQAQVADRVGRCDAAQEPRRARVPRQHARRHTDGTTARLCPPDLNPVEYLWAWLKRHALANFCPDTLAKLKHTARRQLKSGQKRKSIIIAGWKIGAGPAAGATPAGVARFGKNRHNRARPIRAFASASERSPSLSAPACRRLHPTPSTPPRSQ